MRTQRTHKAVQWMVMIVGVAAMLSSAGCATKRGGKKGPSEGSDTFGPGGFLGEDPMGMSAEGSKPMLGDSFTSLPKVEGVVYGPVYFGYDNYQIPASEYAKIDVVADFLRANDNVVLIIEGHCDERGTNEYNMSLGEYRAQSVRSYLVNAGISPDRVQTVSFGEEQPASMGTGESVWRLNRRGEFGLYQR